MSATNLTLQDGQKTIAITVPGAMMENDPSLVALSTALDALNNICPISTVMQSGGFTYIVTLKDARVYTATIKIGPPFSAQLVSDSFWTLAEQSLMRVLAVAMNALLVNASMSACSVTYA